MRYTVLVHDLGTTKLQVRSVDLTTKKLVERLVTSQDQGRALDLDHTLTETSKVGTNTDTAASDDGGSEDLVLGTASLTGNKTTARETLNTKTTIGLADDIADDVVVGTVGSLDRLGHDTARSLGLNGVERLIVKVDVLEALSGVIADELDLEEVHDLSGQSDTSTRVGRDVETGSTDLTSELGGSGKEAVLDRTERTGLDGDIVANDNEFATGGVLGSEHLDEPGNHADGVHTRGTLDLTKVLLLIEDELDSRLDHLGRDLAGSNLPPRGANCLAKNIDEVVDERSLQGVGTRSSRLESDLGGVWEVGALGVEGSLLALRLDAAQDNGAIFGDDLLVGLVSDHQTGLVEDKGADGASLAVGVAEDHSDLSTSDAETEEAGTVTLEETGDGLLNRLEADVELVDERHEDVRRIGGAVLGLTKGNLDDVENVVDDTV